MTNAGFDDLPDPSQTQALIRHARAGDRAALAELLEHHQDRLLRIVRLYLGTQLRSHLESMDIVQAANAVVVREFDALEAEDPARWQRWLTKVVINQIRAAHDHHGAQRRDAAREEPIATREPLAQQTAPMERAAKNEVRRLLDDAVATLPDDARRVVVLRDYCGFSFDAIAEDLARSDGATRMLHARAWEKLRAQLTPRLRQEDDA